MSGHLRHNYDDDPALHVFRHAPKVCRGTEGAVVAVIGLDVASVEQWEARGLEPQALLVLVLSRGLVIYERELPIAVSIPTMLVRGLGVRGASDLGANILAFFYALLGPSSPA